MPKSPNTRVDRVGLSRGFRATHGLARNFRSSHGEMAFKVLASSIFRETDADRSDSIDSRELGGMLESLGLTLTPEEVSVIVKRYDEDSNGTLDEKEWLTIVSDLIDGSFEAKMAAAEEEKLAKEKAEEEAKAALGKTAAKEEEAGIAVTAPAPARAEAPTAAIAEAPVASVAPPAKTEAAPSKAAPALSAAEAERLLSENRQLTSRVTELESQVAELMETVGLTPRGGERSPRGCAAMITSSPSSARSQASPR